MCYDAAQLAFRVCKEAVRLEASKEEINRLRERWKQLEKVHTNYYHISGFQHPKLLAYHLDKDDSLDIDHFYWGLIPKWAKDEEHAEKIWNSTINARSESLSEKPSFRDAYLKHRCLIPLQGFYEHHHSHGKSFPYFIREHKKEVMFVAGIFDEWLNKNTGELVRSMSVVTTRGNNKMATIHNNPKLDEPRMPLILEDSSARKWLNEPEVVLSEFNGENLQLNSWTVRKLRGKQYAGNTKKAWEKYNYGELNDHQKLF